MMRYLIILLTVLYTLGHSTMVATSPGVVSIPIPISIKDDGSYVHPVWNISYPVSQEELGCLALNIYFEARGEVPDGQFGVADVVMHRVNHSRYPDTICGVVKQGIYPSWDKSMPLLHKCHFSWYCDRKPDNPIDGEAFATAMYVAETVLNDHYYIPVVNYALFYHARSVTPFWANKKYLVADIGNHLYYNQ